MAQNQPPAERLGELVTKHRKAQSRSSRDVAREANIDIATMVRLERGYYPTPSPMTLRGIARALGIPVLELFQTVEYVTPHDVIDFATSTANLNEQEAAQLRNQFLERLIDDEALEMDPRDDNVAS
jgi:transcriptional regulator with XRE-family HTH domain